MEGGDAVARFEFGDVGTDGVDDAGDIVALVDGGFVGGEDFGAFPGRGLVGLVWRGRGRVGSRYQSLGLLPL